MARLLKGLPEEFQSMVKSEYGFLRFDADEVQDEWDMGSKALKNLEKRALFVWKLQMADSYAYYEVVKLKPLQLKWIPFGDQHQAPDYVIRGLRTEDVEKDMEWEKRWNRAVAKSRSKANA